MTRDPGKPEHPDCHQPERHHRAEQSANTRSALGLEGEHGDKNDD
jgi:hypothetical protein